MVTTKAQLRKLVRDELRGEAGLEREAASARACELLCRQAVWQQSAGILFYAALPAELDLGRLIAQAVAEGKRAALPRYNLTAAAYFAHEVRHPQDGLAKGPFNILEPVETSPPLDVNQLDLILVPGVAFDLNGRRLGRGRGFYDRLLAEASTVKCGVAFDFQIKDEIPVEPHDVPVDYILTPSRFCRARPLAVS